MPTSGSPLASPFAFLRMALCAMVALSSLPALFADDKGREQIEKTIQAYQNTKQYQSYVVVTVLQDGGRIKSYSTGDYHFAFDRDKLRLLNDRTDFFMVIDQGKLSVKSEQIAGSFAKIDAPNPLTYEEILKSTSFVQNITQPDMMYLTSVMPSLYLAGRLIDNKAWETVPPRPDDAAKRHGIKAAIGNEEITYWIDPATQLITQIVRGPGPEIKNPVKLFTTYDIQIKVHNKELPKDAFAFDAQGLAEIPAIDAWLAPKPAAPGQPGPVAPAQGGAAPAPAGQGQGGAAVPAENPEAHAKPLDFKDIALTTLDDKQIKLADLPNAQGNKVIVLTFWESWARSCQQAMPKMQTVSDWMAQTKTPGAYYAVNIREQPKDVKAFLTQNKLTLPVLLDMEGKASEFFNVNNLPKTVILINGKEYKTFTGLSPNMDREIKSAIQEGLKRAEREEKTPPAPPAEDDTKI